MKIQHGGPKDREVDLLLQLSRNKKNDEIEALAQCIPPPRHVLPVSQYGSGSGSLYVSMIRIATKI